MKRFVSSIAITLCIILLPACAYILEDERTVTSPHTAMQTPGQNDETLTAADYESLKSAVSDAVLRRADKCEVNIFQYNGDLNDDIEIMLNEITVRDPFGAYVIEEISVETAQIVSYIKLEVNFAYKRTRAEMNSVISVSNEEELREELMRLLTDYRSRAAILSDVPGCSASDMPALITEMYYENPLLIVMLPVTEAEEYPKNPDAERLVEIQFGYSQQSTVLRSFGVLLDIAARDIAENAEGENAFAVVRELCESLADIVTYDTSAAMVAEYSTQNFSATAYGALLGNSAISEGYAMAFKALCDVLEYDCTVVLGTRGGRRYVWNIVTIDDVPYHLDAAMCDEEGFGGYFLRSDAAMSEMGYMWDEKYPDCIENYNN